MADHPVIAGLVKIRAYLERIRPLDKRLRYQMDKLLAAAAAAQVQQGCLTLHAGCWIYCCPQPLAFSVMRQLGSIFSVDSAWISLQPATVQAKSGHQLPGSQCRSHGTIEF